MAQIPEFIGFLEAGRHIIEGGSPAEQAQFAELWNLHLVSIQQGAMVISIPNGMGAALDAAGILEQTAKQVGALTMEDCLVAFDNNIHVYHIGVARTLEYYAIVVLYNVPYVAPYVAGDIANGAFGFQNAPGQVADHHVNNLGLDAAAPGPQNPVKIPKPRNKWIFYRADKHKEFVAKHPDWHTSKISVEIAALWKNESQAVKDHYQQLAEDEKEMYRQKYPGYKCAPRKSSEIKKRKTAKARQHAAQDVAGLIAPIGLIVANAGVPNEQNAMLPAAADEVRANNEQAAALAEAQNNIRFNNEQSAKLRAARNILFNNEQSAKLRAARNILFNNEQSAKLRVARDKIRFNNEQNAILAEARKNVALQAAQRLAPQVIEQAQPVPKNKFRVFTMTVVDAESYTGADKAVWLKVQDDIEKFCKKFEDESEKELVKLQADIDAAYQRMEDSVNNM